MRRIFAINDDYFKTINSNSAYIMGFILADGCIIDARKSKYLTITLQSRDIEVLEFIRDEISPTRPINFVHDKKHVRLVINSDIMCEDLISYGIIPRKGGHEYLPKINKKYYPDLIRGLFDGDGCICQRKTRPESIFKITSASITVIYGLIKYFGFGYHKPENENYGNYIVHKRDELVEIREIFYYNDNIFFLKRKRDIFFNIHEIIRINAFGENKKISEWVRDDRCLVSANCIKYRVKTLKMSYEEAMTIPPHSKKYTKYARISI